MWINKAELEKLKRTKKLNALRKERRLHEELEHRWSMFAIKVGGVIVALMGIFKVFRVI